MDIRPVADPTVSGEKWKVLPVRSGAIGLSTPRTSFILSWKPCQHRKARKRNGPTDLKGAIFVQRHDYLHRKSQRVYSQTTRTNSELSGSQVQHLSL